MGSPCSVPTMNLEQRSIFKLKCLKYQQNAQNKKICWPTLLGWLAHIQDMRLLGPEKDLDFLIHSVFFILIVRFEEGKPILTKVYKGHHCMWGHLPLTYFHVQPQISGSFAKIQLSNIQLIRTYFIFGFNLVCVSGVLCCLRINYQGLSRTCEFPGIFIMQGDVFNWPSLSCSVPRWKKFIEQQLRLASWHLFILVLNRGGWV